mgnify:CR=1 FL=1
MKPTEPGFDPVKANEDAEREWYARCVNKALWKPARAEFHDILMSHGSQVYELRERLNRLAIVCAVEGAGIFALFYLLFKG